MTTALITHRDCLDHVTPPGHPERVARLEAINRRLDAPEFSDLLRLEAPICDPEHLLRVHPQSYIDRVRAKVPASGTASLDPDTHLSPGSLNAALRAAGANVLAVDKVIEGEVRNAFCAVRPPGHHAEAGRAMGFCLFGSAAIGAMHALEGCGLDRVAIVDFDVHHGNGTSDLLWNEGRALFASTHQMPLYPGTGYPSETGAHGQIVNVPLDPGAGGVEFRRAMSDVILPRVREHAPGCIIISAGFDAHRRDPLANLALQTEDFVWATEALCDAADTLCGGRVVSTLEGGYDLDALSDSVAAHLGVLMRRGA